MPQQHPQQVANALREMQQTIREQEARIADLEGRRLTCMDRGARDDVPAPLDGQLIVEASDDTAWFYANGEWHPFCCED